MTQRIADPFQEALFLLLLADLEPYLDQNDAAVDNVFFDFRAPGEETAVRFLGDEAHHVFDAGAIVPASIEYDDLARGGKAFDVALNEHLAFFAVRRRRQGGDPEHPRADALGERLDGAAFSGGVPPFENDDDAGARCLDPVLQAAKLRLQLAKLLFVGLALHLLGFAVFAAVNARLVRHACLQSKHLYGRAAGAV